MILCHTSKAFEYTITSKKFQSNSKLEVTNVLEVKRKTKTIEVKTCENQQPQMESGYLRLKYTCLCATEALQRIRANILLQKLSCADYTNSYEKTT